MGDGPELIGGRESRAIELVPCDSSQRSRFAHERKLIATALGDRARRI